MSKIVSIKQLQPESVLMVKIPRGNLPSKKYKEQIETISKSLKDCFPNNKHIIVGESVEINIINNVVEHE